MACRFVVTSTWRTDLPSQTALVRIGVLGKEGASGGWSHLHFEIVSRQPSGKWGTQAGYALIREAYIRQYQPSVIACARIRYFITPGESVTLDGSPELRTKSDGNGPALNKDGYAIVRHTYRHPGHYLVRIKRLTDSGTPAFEHLDVQVSP